MKRLIVLVAFVAAGCAYHAPTEPTPVVVASSSAPASIRLTAASRPDRTTDVVATLLTSSGAVVVGAPLTFETSAGSLSTTSGMTDAAGAVRSVLTSGTTAIVRATASGVMSELTVNGVPPIADPPAGPGPTLPVPTPAPVTPTASLNVASTGTTGIALVFGVAAPALGQTWFWTFGDGQSAQTTAFTTTHTYTTAGNYLATVAAAGLNTASARVTVTDPPAPPAPAPTGLTVATGCTAGVAAAKTACNIEAAYNGAALFSTAITKVDWDWGDAESQIVTSNAAVGTHVYASPGTYKIVPNVTAMTVDGLQRVIGATQSVTIK